MYKLSKFWRTLTGFAELIFGLCFSSLWLPEMYHSPFTYKNGEVSNNYWLSRNVKTLENKRLLVVLPGGFGDGRNFSTGQLINEFGDEFDHVVVFHNPGIGKVGRIKNIECVPPTGYHIPPKFRPMTDSPHDKLRPPATLEQRFFPLRD